MEGNFSIDWRQGGCWLRDDASVLDSSSSLAVWPVPTGHGPRGPEAGDPCPNEFAALQPNLCVFHLSGYEVGLP